VDIGYDRTGSLVIAKDRDEAHALRRLYEYQQSIELPVEWLTTSAALEVEPLLSPRIAGAIRSPHDHQVDNRALLRALEAAARAAGVEVREEHPVREVLCSSGSVSGIRTELEHVDATDVLVAAGAWSPTIEGLQTPPPIRPVKGQMLALIPSDGLTLSHVIRSKGVYLAPKANRWVLGATSEEKGFDARVTAGGVYQLLDEAQKMLPGIMELELASTWAGFRPASRDNGPILGGCDVDGLWFCTGHYRNGIQQAPVSIDALCSMLLGTPGFDEVAPFTLSRFAP
jgi:glycine oxidase